MAVEPLHAHYDEAQRQHERDLARGAGRIERPHALARNLPNASRSRHRLLGLADLWTTMIRTRVPDPGRAALLGPSRRLLRGPRRPLPTTRVW